MHRRTGKEVWPAGQRGYLQALLRSGSAEGRKSTRCTGAGERGTGFSLQGRGDTCGFATAWLTHGV